MFHFKSTPYPQVDAFVRMGIKDDKLFQSLGPKILAKQNELTDDQMGKCIKAYAEFEQCEFWMEPRLH